MYPRDTYHSPRVPAGRVYHGDDEDANSFTFDGPNTAPYLTVYGEPSALSNRVRGADAAPATPFAELYELASWRKDSTDFQYEHNLPPAPPPSKNPFDVKPYTPYMPTSVAPPPPPLNDFGSNAFDNKLDTVDERLHDFDKARHMERQRIKLLRRKPRFHYSRLPYVTIVFTIIQVCVFIAELIKMAQLTGSAFQTQPYFNPMLGPSTYLLINMGARYVPCMHQIEGVTTDNTIQFPCPNSTTVETNVCLLPQLCGLSAISTYSNDGGVAYLPHQWYRIFTPIFLHAGFLHIIFNLLLQVTMGATIERQIGCLKYLIIYVACGISGFLLGANFSPDGIASTGALGSLFGIIAVNMLCFMYCGKKNTNIYGTKKFGLFIVIMVAEIVVSLVLGLLPGMDNFSHIGGFAMGILLGLALLPDPCLVYIDYIIAYDGHLSTWQQFMDNWNPFHNWQDKVPARVYAWFGVRSVALGLVGAYFGSLLGNFFNNRLSPTDNSCKWCKFFNCLPVNGWCDVGTVTVLSTPDNTSLSQSPTTNDATETPTQTLPSEVNNPNFTGASPVKREFYTFIAQPVIPHLTIEAADHVGAGIGAGFCVLALILTLRLFKSKNKN